MGIAVVTYRCWIWSASPLLYGSILWLLCLCCARHDSVMLVFAHMAAHTPSFMGSPHSGQPPGRSAKKALVTAGVETCS